MGERPCPVLYHDRALASVLPLVLEEVEFGARAWTTGLHCIVLYVGLRGPCLLGTLLRLVLARQRIWLPVVWRCWGI